MGVQDRAVKGRVGQGMAGHNCTARAIEYRKGSRTE